MVSEYVDTLNVVFTQQKVDAAGSFIPTTKVKKGTCGPWWNDDCSNAKKARQMAHTKLRRTRLLADWDDYKPHCAVVKHITKQTKRSYWR